MAQSTCSVDNCHQIAVSRNWCRKHYNQNYKGTIKLVQVVTVSRCPRCGIDFNPFGRQVYCTQRCREEAKYQAMRDDAVAWAAYLERCRGQYTKKTEQPGYVRPPNPNKVTDPCIIDGCERRGKSRRMCAMHYKRWARAAGMKQPPSSSWNDRARSNWHARRARMNGAQDGDRVMLAELLERDQATCSACHLPIDVDLAWPDPYSPSIDHTIPVSRGGQHSMANTTAMHLRCNISKGARMTEADDEAQQSPSVTTARTSSPI